MAACDLLGHKMSFWYVRNNSSRKIYFYSTNQYPDTLLPSTKKYVIPIKPNSEYTIDIPGVGDMGKEFSKFYTKDTMLIFFFDGYIVERYDWEIIRRDYMILERRVYSKQDLIKSDWRIVYP